MVLVPVFRASSFLMSPPMNLLVCRTGGSLMQMLEMLLPLAHSSLMLVWLV